MYVLELVEGGDVLEGSRESQKLGVDAVTCRCPGPEHYRDGRARRRESTTKTGTDAELPQADEIKPLATYSKGGLRVTNHSTRYICQRKSPFTNPLRRLPLVLPPIHPLPLIDPSFPLVETRFRDSIRSIALYLPVAPAPTTLSLACDACRAWYSKIGPVLLRKKRECFLRTALGPGAPDCAV